MKKIKIVGAEILEADEEGAQFLQVELKVPEDLKNYRFVWIRADQFVPLADWLEYIE